jgi:hypothetical protein
MAIEPDRATEPQQEPQQEQELWSDLSSMGLNEVQLIAAAGHIILNSINEQSSIYRYVPPPLTVTAF